jgi:MarR family transcriptional regulator, organic hydroperoxide resistance regulator
MRARVKVVSNDEATPNAVSLELQNSLPFLLRKAHRNLVRALEDALQGKGLNSGHWYFLRVLWEREGMIQSELSAQVGIMTPATVSALNTLEKRKLIQRRSDPDDKRKIRIYLTPEGKRLERELMPIAQTVLAEQVRGISDRDVNTCRKVLQSICRNFGAGSDD